MKMSKVGRLQEVVAVQKWSLFFQWITCRQRFFSAFKWINKKIFFFSGERNVKYKELKKREETMDGKSELISSKK